MLSLLHLATCAALAGAPAVLDPRVAARDSARLVSSTLLSAGADSTRLPADSARLSVAGPRLVASSFGRSSEPRGAAVLADAGLHLIDTTRVRPRAIEYSDWYARRLTVHRVASYTMLPLFGAEYLLGRKLLDHSTASTRNQHAVAAGGVAALFGVNTITGVWNWWDTRNDPAGRTRRTVHTVLMLAADAGFAATGVLADKASHSTDDAHAHRNVALGSMGVAAVGSALMWFWKE